MPRRIATCCALVRRRAVKPAASTHTMVWCRAGGSLLTFAQSLRRHKGPVCVSQSVPHAASRTPTSMSDVLMGLFRPRLDRSHATVTAQPHPGARSVGLDRRARWITAMPRALSTPLEADMTNRRLSRPNELLPMGSASLHPDRRRPAMRQPAWHGEAFVGIGGL